jgi:tetratricopeptide (TPR) repeat protein
MVNRMMNCCVRMNNAGTQRLAQGMFAEAADSFKGSLRLVESALAARANDAGRRDGADEQHSARERSGLKRAIVLPIHHRQMLCEERQSQLLVASQGLYLSPLNLCDDIDFELEAASSVEAAIAIMFNLALSHHLHALYGEHGSVHERQSTLDQAIALYELAWRLEMQEEADLCVEFTMAIVNNLGHAHRVKGNHEKSHQCFRHLLSTILFLQAYGPTNYRTEEFVHSVTHLILRETVAAAA